MKLDKRHLGNLRHYALLQITEITIKLNPFQLALHTHTAQTSLTALTNIKYFTKFKREKGLYNFKIVNIITKCKIHYQTEVGKPIYRQWVGTI